MLNRRLLCHFSLQLCLFLFSAFLKAQVVPLQHAHAHNDYKHKHPLYDAMGYGFTSFEADIFLKHQTFIIAHVSPIFKKRKTLEALYLQPLAELLKEKAYVYDEYHEPILLLIDIKTEANSTYLALLPLLEKYKQLLSSCTNGKVQKGAITIVLTGNKPTQLLQQETTRLMFLDESLLSIQKNKFSNTLAPLTSTKYSNLLKWKGKGTVPENEKNKLKEFTQLAHAQGKKVRLWASPENKEVWKLLLDCGVDYINTDQLQAFSNFSKKNP